MKRGFLNSSKAKKVRSNPPTKANDSVSDGLATPSIPEDKTPVEYIEDEYIDYLSFAAMEVDKLDVKQSLHKSLHDTMNVGDDNAAFTDLVFTSQPPQPKDVLLKAQPDPWTECLVTVSIKENILKTLSLKKISCPKESSHRIATSPASGLFATRDLDMGGLILSERPSLIVPAKMRAPEVHDGPAGPTILYGVNNERATARWNAMLGVCLDRMSPERRSAFWTLKDIEETDGKKSIYGIVQTNGFRIVGMDDKDFGPYTGVFETLSLLNHSCRPNVERYWDMASFSMQLRAIRKIQAGEELFVSFCNHLEPYASRKKHLDLFKIVCSCTSCKKHKISDFRRAYFPKAVVSPDEFIAWIENAKLPDDYIIKRCLVQMSLLEDEGLENSPYYESHIGRIYYSFVALGDEESAKRWGLMLARWESSRYGSEAVVKWLKPSTYKDHIYWNKRLAAKVAHEANSGTST